MVGNKWKWKDRNNKNSLLGAIRRLKPAVLRSSLNREFLELKTVGLKSEVLNPPVFNKIISILLLADTHSFLRR
ncbi:MAG TPA: hypothetical protein VI894_01365 [Candidatus Nanoarchaeia archaeon]|nr:hypothetical protein [Candidatus Nanoarchaeia archaeon]